VAERLLGNRLFGVGLGCHDGGLGGAEELSEQMARVPDLTKALRDASPEVQRQVFEAFELQILYDKAERRIEISATVSEAVASAFEKKKALPKEGSLVVLTDIAGARFVSRYHRTRIRETSRHPS
jgi:hypothetical protein